jgi:hypothetical protein
MISTDVERIVSLQAERRITPEPRAVALRMLEEMVELALECGASVKDARLYGGRSVR